MFNTCDKGLPLTIIFFLFAQLALHSLLPLTASTTPEETNQLSKKGPGSGEARYRKTNKTRKGEEQDVERNSM